MFKHSLSRELKQRILSYTRQSYITASWICALRGKDLTRKERKAIIYIGAITPLLDDLTDSSKLTSKEILRLLKNRSNDNRNEITAVARYLYTKLITSRNENFNKVFKTALVAQDASLRQMEGRKLSDKELKTISRDKGSSFVLLFRTILETPINDAERNALITLGYILQQINDMFDIYKDHINGQQTLFTNTSDINENYLDYQLNLKRLVSQFYKLDFKKDKIKKCLTEISTVTSRGFVCLDQLKMLQGNSHEFNSEKYTRKQLICNMEKIGNIRRSFLYSVEFYNKLIVANQ